MSKTNLDSNFEVIDGIKVAIPIIDRHIPSYYFNRVLHNSQESNFFIPIFRCFSRMILINILNSFEVSMNHGNIQQFTILIVTQ